MSTEELSHVGMFNCFLCGEPAGVVLDRRLQKTLPRNVGCIDRKPCNKCKEFMKQGIILISVDEIKTHDKTQPYRSGGWCVIKEDAAARIFGKAPEGRVAFVTDEAWDKLGLPR